MSVREHWINVRVNPEELARIREKQKELGIRNTDRKSTRLNSSHPSRSRMPSSA